MIIRVIIIGTVVYLAWLLFNGYSTRDVTQSAEDAGRAVENSTVGREVKKSWNAIEDYIP